MARDELAQLELLAEVDALLGRLRRWADAAPPWQPAEGCQALVRRLADRAETLRVRMEAPLVVATLGGTGTGKSSLVNALLGAEVVTTGRQRPTTTRPTLICRPDLTPEMLGIDPASVTLVQRELPALAELVLVDCPDPDTTEEASDASVVAGDAVARSEDPLASNLARLRKILPKCDVLLVTTTQQKYRSARVAEELAAAAGGARLIFVQTHADVDDDVRSDWSELLEEDYSTGRILLVDSLAALADAQQGLQPRGDFAVLVDLLTRQLAGTAATRIRRANFLDLVAETLERCRRRIDEAMPAVEQLREAIAEKRRELGAQLAVQMQAELQGSRRQWENRLLGQTATRWGLSPFALVLRVFQGVGGLVTGSLLWRARTPAQVALWGAFQGARVWQKQRQEKQADQSVDRAVAGCWGDTELRSAALVLGGYASEAGLPRDTLEMDHVTAEAEQAGGNFVARVSTELQEVISKLAQRHTGWFTRLRYELLLAAMLGVLLYRLGRNFFYDSWLAPEPVEVYGLNFYLTAGFWLLLWCLLLIWALSRRLRRGLRREIDVLAGDWSRSDAAAGVFVGLEQHALGAERFRQDLDVLDGEVNRLRRQLALPEEELGHSR